VKSRKGLKIEKIYRKTPNINLITVVSLGKLGFEGDLTRF